MNDRPESVHDTSVDQPSRLVPTLIPNSQSSTSSVGGALGVLFIYVCHKKGIDFDAGVEASIAVLFMGAATYLHNFLQVLLDRLRRG